MDNSYILILTTVPTEQHAADLARSLVSARLAACVQLQTIRSIYRWQDELCDEPEVRLAIKTTAQLYPHVEQHIKANHPYQTPQILQLPITGGSSEYLAWIDECLTGPPTE